MLWVCHRQYDPENVKDVAQLNQTHAMVKELRRQRNAIVQSLASHTKNKNTPDMEYDLSNDTFYVNGDGLITEPEAVDVNKDMAMEHMHLVTVYNKVQDGWFYLEARVETPFRGNPIISAIGTVSLSEAARSLVQQE